MQKVTLAEVRASGEDIDAIMAALEPIVLRYHPSHAFIACLAIACLLNNPASPIEAISGAVKKASEVICLHLAGYGEDKIQGVQ